ncbi:Myeloid differentiation primary response protein MyD88 [Desmophyllum pertusum]|uniref:Myeloid differentiation primary response protein MyD88 n=1 Tax=Desmophyllum pertusum TaxID=174260 RepID=A0A9W9YYZ0_9CNID|nr:Myeloid differentiation primary response protein MyD88 [Desmophyllum pertusum]
MAHDEDITSADNEKLVKDMPKDAHTMLIKHLQPKNIFGRNYKLFADKLGYSYQDIQYLESKDKPVQQIIEEKGDRTIAEWISLLKDMERKDVAEDLEKFIEKTPTPRQLKLRKSYVKRIRNRRPVGNLTMHLFALAMKIESGSVFETTAVAIEKTCKKFVVILSSNFDHSEGAHYESQIATGLSPGAKEKRLIPVLIEEAYRSKIPRTISHITYLDYLRQDEKHFWDLLAQSLGWSAK